MGNDVAFFVIVAPANKAAVLERLIAEAKRRRLPSAPDDQILALIKARFPDYISVKSWLDASGLPYEKDSDGNA